jgi:glycerophosphoryl diester phosphodiesterase
METNMIRRAIPAIILVTLLPGFENAIFADDEPTAGNFLKNGVTAHRGNSSEFPENTIPAFESGIAIGADWIELDVLRTQDGKIVVIHDATTGRVGDVDLVVADSTYEQLRTVDVATDFRRRTKKTVSDVPKQTIPLLEDVLKVMMTQRKSRVSIQPKTDCVDEVIAIIEALGAEPWVGFNDGNLKFMSQVKQWSSTVPVFWDRSVLNLSEDIRIARQRGFESLVLHHTLVTKEVVQQIHEAGLKAGAWTVNDRTTMERLLGMGVDRIYTDFPRRLLQQIQ